MPIDDGLADHQAEACSLCLGGEQWLKNVLWQALKAWASILKAQRVMASLLPGYYVDVSHCAATNGFAGISNQIVKDLMHGFKVYQQVTVDYRRGKRQLSAGEFCDRAHLLRHLVEKSTETHAGQTGLRSAGIGSQSADNIAATFNFFDDFVKFFGQNSGILCRSFFKHACRYQYRAERVVNFMGYSG
jgi:hypothetical protein